MEFFLFSEMISIIIPSYFDQKHVNRLCLEIIKQDFVDYEIIIVEADNQLNNFNFTRTNIYHLKSNIANRAHQMNMGAEKAQGEWLFFLHADSYLMDKDLLIDLESKVSEIKTKLIKTQFSL